MDRGKILAIGFVLFVCVLIGGAIFYGINNPPPETTIGWLLDETYFYEGYVMKAPFGVFATEGEGSIRGGSILFFSYIRGSFEYGMEEIYVIKFINNGELKTMKFNSEEIAVIPDGRFGLEELVYNEYKYEVESGYRIRQYGQRQVYKIHIPYLPRVNQTITEDWD